MILAFLSAIVGLLIENIDLANFRTSFNPFWFAAQGFDHRTLSPALEVWLILAAFTIFVQSRHAMVQRKNIRKIYRLAAVELRDQKLNSESAVHGEDS